MQRVILISKNIYSKNIMKQSIIAGKNVFRISFVFFAELFIFFLIRLNLLTLEFAIHAIQLKNQDPFSLPDCYHFVVKVKYFYKNIFFFGNRISFFRSYSITMLELEKFVNV